MRRTICAAGLSLAAMIGAAQADQSVTIANWNHYIASDTLANFTRQTGIQTTYDLIDSNETTEAKLMTGASGYDLASPSNHFLPRLIRANAIQPLDKPKLPNWQNLDPKLMKMLETSDPGNQYAVPYLWMTVGVGFNKQKIEALFGSDEVTRSWATLFKPENLEKLQQCGISMIDNATQMVPIMLNALGLDPHSERPEDFKQAEQALLAVRPYVRYFDQSKYVIDLANGDICLAIGFSGDVLQAMTSASEAGNGIQIQYSIPVEGTTLAVDTVVIPKNAPHLDNAYRYLNYLLEPQVMANISNAVNYPNGNLAARQYLAPEVRDNPAVYPPQQVLDSLFTIKTLSPSAMRASTRLWTRMKSGV
ncbi:polyamine ABC transporter substrate-binding protein [Pseudomonas sp. Marseille-QA0332]